MHRNGHELVEGQFRVGPTELEAAGLVPDDDRGRYAEVDLLGCPPSGGDRADPAHTRVAERLHHRHRGHTLQDLDRETRSGRGSYDLGIVRVDRSRPEDDYRSAG